MILFKCLSIAFSGFSLILFKLVLFALTSYKERPITSVKELFCLRGTQLIGQPRGDVVMYQAATEIRPRRGHDAPCLISTSIISVAHRKKISVDISSCYRDQAQTGPRCCMLNKYIYN